MWAHGKFLTDCQAKAIIDKIDQKKDGVIDYSEFLLVVARKILISKLELEWTKQQIIINIHIVLLFLVFL